MFVFHGGAGNDSKRVEIIHSETRRCLCMIHLCSLSTRRCLGILSSCDSGVDLLAILPPNSGRRCTVATAFARADTDDWTMS